MKATVNTKELLRGLEKAALLTGSAQVGSYRDKVELIATTDGLKLSVSAPELGAMNIRTENTLILTAEGASVEVEGNTILDNIKSTIKALKHFESADNTIIELIDGKVTLGQGKRQISVLTVATDFEAIPALEIAPTDNHSYNQKTLLSRLKTVDYAKAKDETRPILQGICFRDSDMAALDGYRLALSEDADLSIPGTHVLNPTALMVLLKTLESKSDDAEITISTYEDDRGDKYLGFEYTNIKLTSKCLEGQYMNYRDILRHENSLKIEPKCTKQLLKEIKFLSDLNTESKNNCVVMNIADKVELSCGAYSALKGSSEIEATIDGENLEIGFNGKYMKEVLAVIGGNPIEMSFSSPVNPIKMQYGQNTHILLPIKLKD